MFTKTANAAINILSSKRAHATITFRKGRVLAQIGGTDMMRTTLFVFALLAILYFFLPVLCLPGLYAFCR